MPDPTPDEIAEVVEGLKRRYDAADPETQARVRENTDYLLGYMSEQQIRQRIRGMIDVDYQGQVDFVERLAIVKQEVLEDGSYPATIRVTVALDLIQDVDW